MSTTVTYKGNTITTVDNETKVLATGGKYLEGNITLEDVPSGGSGPKEAKDINFIDYDGTIVESFTAAEWANVTELPANPNHTDIGLTAQGWNWTKQAIDTQLTNVGGEVVVGQMYATVSGDTEIDIVLDDELALNPFLALYVNGTITVDWGDNSTPSTVTASSSFVCTEHAYQTIGSYTISIHLTSGQYQLGTNQEGRTLLAKSATSLSYNYNAIYANTVKFVRVANGHALNGYAFCYLGELEYVTLPSSVTSTQKGLFYRCHRLKSVTLPSGVSEILIHAFDICLSLESVSFPASVTTFANYTFNIAPKLKHLTIPYGTDTIGSSFLNTNSEITKVHLPSSMTSSGGSFFTTDKTVLEEAVFGGVVPNMSSSMHLRKVTIKFGCTELKASAFSSCVSLTKVVVPATVTVVGNQAFNSCYSLKEIHFLSTSPPTFDGSSVFQSLPADCVIYVPNAALNDYKTANNISNQIASQMVGF